MTATKIPAAKLPLVPPLESAGRNERETKVREVPTDVGISPIGNPSPSNAQYSFSTPHEPRVRWYPQDVDPIMRRFGLADFGRLLRAAIALDDGDGVIDASEFERGAKAVTGARLEGIAWHPANMPAVDGAGSASILAAAASWDDGDYCLSAAELERAANLLTLMPPPHAPSIVSERMADLAQRYQETKLECLTVVDGHRIEALHIPSVGPTRKRLLITGGVHGDEPVGPGAATLLAEELLKHPELREGVAVTIIPTVNPRGQQAVHRGTPEGDDLNRVQGQSFGPQEAVAINDFLERQADTAPYDVAVDLHSGGAQRNGFWLLQRGDPTIFQRAMRTFVPRWARLNTQTRPYDLNEIGVGTSNNPGTLKDAAFASGIPVTATLEAPGSLAYGDQVLGMFTMVNKILREVRAGSSATV